ncbi:sensor histidine kinase [Curtobacterium sp. PhB78]|uniref:sensor histidine kinase n=1 Tax=Curtobacterium sp. PhB78 TaxID=2485102 RepID=UPI000F47DC11|nr:histidine kinase [Curtobacterium sp. PhB78]ROS33372.1 signal transduction histidine kinase [Curtobacterium sp. PhB78]
MTTAPRSDDLDRAGARWRGRPRFARVGRVVPVAFVQIVGTLLAARITPAGPGGPPWTRSAAAVGVDPVVLGPLAVALLVAGVVVLPWRWRWPRSVLLLTLATTVGYAVVVSPRGPFVAALTMAMANAWLRGHRRTVAAAAVVAVAVLPTADVVLGRAPTIDLAAVGLCVAWVTVTIVVAELVRVRTERVAERRRARVEAERRRAGEERVRIARELHDSVAHSMSLITLQAGVALHLGAELPAPTRQALVNIRDSSRDALVELRTILGVLRSVDSDRRDGDGDGPDRSPVPGLERVPDLVERARAAGVAIELCVDGDLGSVQGTTGRSAFRIVQESVTNVMKHATGHVARIEVTIGPDVLDLAVEDRPTPGAPTSSDGTAVPAGIGTTGNGVIGMRERAAAVGGDLRVGPTTDGGWRVAARLPLGTDGSVDSAGGAVDPADTSEGASA